MNRWITCLFDGAHHFCCLTDKYDISFEYGKVYEFIDRLDNREFLTIVKGLEDENGHTFDLFYPDPKKIDEKLLMAYRETNSKGYIVGKSIPIKIEDLSDYDIFEKDED